MNLDSEGEWCSWSVIEKDPEDANKIILCNKGDINYKPTRAMLPPRTPAA